MSLNIENITHMVPYLRRPEIAAHFNMGYYFAVEDEGVVSEDGTVIDTGTPLKDAINVCGTLGCIAGLTVVELSDAKYGQVQSYLHEAAELLGISTEYEADDAAWQLFVPDAWKYDYRKITNLIAADVLENLAKTGKVEWPEEVWADGFTGEEDQ